MLTINGDFCPGAMPGPLGSLALIEATGVCARYTFHPILTFREAQPASKKRNVAIRQAEILLTVQLCRRISAGLVPIY